MNERRRKKRRSLHLSLSLFLSIMYKQTYNLRSHIHVDKVIFKHCEVVLKSRIISQIMNKIQPLEKHWRVIKEEEEEEERVKDERKRRRIEEEEEEEEEGVKDKRKRSYWILVSKLST